jgi:hypothetical protein
MGKLCLLTYEILIKQSNIPENRFRIFIVRHKTQYMQIGPVQFDNRTNVQELNSTVLQPFSIKLQKECQRLVPAPQGYNIQEYNLQT